MEFKHSLEPDPDHPTKYRLTIFLSDQERIVFYPLNEMAEQEEIAITHAVDSLDPLGRADLGHLADRLCVKEELALSLSRSSMSHDFVDL